MSRAIKAVVNIVLPDDLCVALTSNLLIRLIYLILIAFHNTSAF